MKNPKFYEVFNRKKKRNHDSACGSWADRGRLRDVVGAHEGVARRPERVGEPALLVDVVAVGLEQVVHEEIVAQHRDLCAEETEAPRR